MAIKDIFKISFKTFVDPASWLGYGLLKSHTKVTWDLVRDVFIPAKPEHEESFAEAMQRLNVSEADLVNLQRLHRYYIGLFLTLGAALLILFFYWLTHASFSGAVLSLAVSGLFFSQAFKYHFQLFQIKHRKLGCTFKEWRNGKPDSQETNS
jgi:intracellular multiplication protein IcmV